MTNFNTNDCEEEDDDITSGTSNQSPLTRACMNNQSRLNGNFEKFQNSFILEQIKSQSKQNLSLGTVKAKD